MSTIDNYKLLHEKTVKSFYFVIAFTIAIDGTMDVFFQRYYLSSIKYTCVLILLILLFFFYKTKKTILFSYILAIVIDLELLFLIYKNDFNDYSVIYPIIFPAGVFLIFNLRNSFIITIIHHIFWILVFYIASQYYQDHLFLSNKIAITKFYTASLIVILMSFLHHIIIQDSYQKLIKLNSQNEVLLREIHHRIKNNLNFISSILGLQQKQLKHKDIDTLNNALKESRLRISAIALVHNTLYEQPDLALVDFKLYAESLVENINKATSSELIVNIFSTNISIKTDSALMLGIMINELLTNSIKYAFNPDDIKQVSITLKKVHTKFYFLYKDHTTKKIDIKNIKSSKGLGIRLIKIVANDLEANFSIYYNKGLVYEMKF